MQGSSSDMTTRTVGGLVAYCDYLRDKGYQTPNAVEAWKVAIKKVFETVEPDGYEAISLEGLDLDDYVRRFRTLAGTQYKAETIGVYQRRVLNAIEAHEYYLANGKPPVFRKGSQRPTDAGTPGTAKKKAAPSKSERSTPLAAVPSERYEFSYPMSYGMAHISLPMRLSRRDIERLTTVLGTLEEQPQIPEHTQERDAA
jgi:hypothetical protein